ncbi:MAG: hypothetical protein HZC42_03705 [Candidatus Eisenbacteria bacterium]|nr:hypothetical protein [Candidatus Eisenbacteria bacterium]
MVWGLFLIGIGVLFMLERFDVVDIPRVGQLWPLVFYVIGMLHFVDQRPGSGVMFVLMGTWFFICEFEWRGLTYGNSWGLLLVAVGAGMVVKALSGERSRRACVTEVRHD